MKWKGQKRSSNIEDRRFSSSGSRGMKLSNIEPIARFLLKTKVGRIALVIGIIAYFFGYNPLGLLDSSSNQTPVNSARDNENANFVATVLAKTEQTWTKVFAKHNAKYKKPKLVLFRNSAQSGCGYASKQTGPFYCPRDQKVYLDLSFFDELASKHHSSGDFAQAYVIAHEIGHHVQNLVGTLDKVHQKQRVIGKKRANALQVKVELQADCYAGIWAYYMKNDDNLLEDGDIEEALRAANAIGDDTLQRQAQGYVMPDSFTHGSSEQRMKWFKKGYINGTLKSCNTGAND